jgi:pimeloyl-ACP methyl ester carboxylesterase
MKKIALILLVLIIGCDDSFPQQNFPFEVKISGKGKNTIIFIPGYACSSDVWNETIKVFEKDYKCIVLSMHGFAGVKADANPNLKHWVDEIARYIVWGKIKNPIIIGHSLGGIMAMWLASDYPKLISKIVDIDAIPCYAALLDANFQSNKKLDCSENIKGMQAMSENELHRTQRANMELMIADTSKIETVVHWNLLSDRKTMGETFCEFLNTDLRDTIARVVCPSLIILEPSFKPSNAAIMGQFKKMRPPKIIYANKGLHFIMFDDKDWYLNQLKAFVKY